MADFSNSTYEEINSHVDTLLSISSENLDAESIRNTKIFTELHKIYVIRARKLIKLKTEKDKLEQKRKRHYEGKMPAEHYKKEPLNEAVLKSDIPILMNIDPLVIEIRGLVDEEEKIVEFLEASKGMLKTRSFDIKNAIAWRQLMMGA